MPKPVIDETGTGLKPVMNGHELAEHLGVTVKALNAWRCNGKGPRFIKCGALVRYRRADIENWMENQSRTRTVVAAM